MKNRNLFEIEGNVGADPKNIFGTVYSFGVAVGCDYKDKQTNEWVNKTCWINVTCIGDPGVSKGNKVNVKGFFETSEKDGKAYVNYKAFAKDVQILTEWTKSEYSQRNAEPAISATVYKATENYKQAVIQTDDEVPF